MDDLNNLKSLDDFEDIEGIISYVREKIGLQNKEEAILRGSWDSETLENISQCYNEQNPRYGFKKGEAKKISGFLFEKLRKVLKSDKHLDKKEFNKQKEKKQVKKYKVSQVSKCGHCVQVDQGNVTIYSEYLEKTESSEDIKNKSAFEFKQKIDLTKAPNLQCNYGRDSEISELKRWILEDKKNLITIYGLQGIGKTALTLRLIAEIKEEFNYIIYYDFDDNKFSLTTLKEELKQFFNTTEITPLSDIFKYFSAYKCLIIIDGLESLFQNKELAGKYLSEYKDYHKFFDKVANTNHQSCLILISREEIKNIINSETLYLQGLGESAKELLREKGLQDEEEWEKLINLYYGNPCWLKIIIEMIKETSNSSVAEFLEGEDIISLGDIEHSLQSYLDRLSESEIVGIKYLANQENPIHNFQQFPETRVSKREIIQSLKRRCLVDTVRIESTDYFQLNLVLKAYISRNDY